MVFLIVSIVTLSLVILTSFAVNMPLCPNGVQEDTANYTLTCEGIDSTERVNWVRSKDGTDADAGTCNPLPDTCLSILFSYMTLTRPSHGVSHMTIKSVSRTQYSGSTITCRTFLGSRATGHASCQLDVVYAANVTLCSVEPTRNGNKWFISGMCSIAKVYSSLNRYNCQLLQRKDIMDETSAATADYTPTFGQGSPVYGSGTCSFSVPLPTATGTYTYTAVVNPGGKRVSAGRIVVALPALPPNISCISSGGSYVEENGYLDCSCFAPDLGQPGGRLFGYRGANLVATGILGSHSLQLPRQQIAKEDDDTIFRCVLLVDWAPQGLQESSDSFTLSVAYGPDTINITDPGVFDVHPSQAETLTLTCVTSEASPAVNFSWTGPCAGSRTAKCTFAPKISDKGNTISCVATNSATGVTKLATLKLQLNYPPPEPPVISGVDNNAIYPGESLVMTCSVLGGVPLVESVTFTCLDQRQEIKGQSSTVNVTVQAGNHGDKCTCTALWKKRLWYSLSSEVTLTVYRHAEIFSFTLNQTSSQLTINESSTSVVRISCIARGIPTPDMRLLRDDDEEVLRQDGGFVVGDMFTTLTFEAPARCESTAHYKCLAKNRLGNSSTATVTLNVICAPRLASGTSKAEIRSVVYRGKPQNLTFDIESVPPPHNFRFLFLVTESGSSDERPARSDILRITCLQALRLWRRRCVITVEVAAEADEGLYRLVFANALGEASFVFNLTTGPALEAEELSSKPASTDTVHYVVYGVLAFFVLGLLVVVIVLGIKMCRQKPQREEETYHTDSEFDSTSDFEQPPPPLSVPSRAASSHAAHLQVSNDSGDGGRLMEAIRSGISSARKRLRRFELPRSLRGAATAADAATADAPSAQQMHTHSYQAQLVPRDTAVEQQPQPALQFYLHPQAPYADRPNVLLLRPPRPPPPPPPASCAPLAQHQAFTSLAPQQGERYGNIHG